MVTAYNSQGQSSSSPLTVAPIANAGGPYGGQAGTSLTVDGSGSNHPAGTIVRWMWNWGDGGTTTMSSASAPHTYAASGTFVIGLTVTDAAGATATASTTATISSTTSSGGSYVSPDGTTVPPATQIVDTLGAAWTIGANNAIFRNGASAAGGIGWIILWSSSKIYVLGTDNNWYLWTGSGWIYVVATGL